MGFTISMEVHVLLKQTPIYPAYQNDAKMITFGDWLMPVQFSSIKQEHEAVRVRAGLFDVSHMGEFEVEGSGALQWLQKLTTNDLNRCQIGQAQYTLLTTEIGTVIDDLLVYRFAKEHFFLVVNAGNIEKDFAWLQQHATDSVRLRNCSAEYALLALQGPRAESILQELVTYDLSSLKTFRFAQEITLFGVPTMISRTGYTGEDGFEIYFAADQGVKLWTQLLQAGREQGLVPCGLGARDTLRFEAGLPLYGQELSDTITPLEAGLAFAVKTDKGDFSGRDVLVKQKEEGPSRSLVGIEMIERGIPRSHYPVFINGQQVGEVTTGTQSPLTKRNIALALLERSATTIGQECTVEIHGKQRLAKVVKTPFYRRDQ